MKYVFLAAIFILISVLSACSTTIIVLAKLTSVCYITRYANGKNKTTNRELRQIPAGIRTCCHTQKGLRRLLTFSMASTIIKVVQPRGEAQLYTI